MFRRLLARKTWLLVAMVVSLVGWSCPAAAYELKVEVLIDGYSQLIIQGNTVQWHNINHDAPGFLADVPGSPFPTYLTTAHMGRVAWNPDWPGGGFGGHDNIQDSSVYSGFNLPLAAVSQTVKVVSWSVDQTRDGLHGVTISQQPSASNGYKLIVDFDDLEPGGAAWYTVTLDYFPAPSNTYTIYPTADAGVYSGNPTSNWGTDAAFVTSITGATSLNYWYSYLKFDLSSIPASEFITGGTLFANCMAVRAGVTLTVQLRPVEDTTWSETGITWNNKPAYGAPITNTAGILGWDHWTIPAANLPATGLVSWMLMPATVGGSSTFYSKESASNRPYLLVTTNTKPKSKALAAIQLLLLD
jgi:hypothetical protein